MSNGEILLRADHLNEVVFNILHKAGLSENDAKICADVLIAADIRGVKSHGVARLGYYLLKLKGGTINKDAKITVANENATCALVDGGGGMGPVVGKFAMELAIKKAGQTGCGFVSVGKSNHYGIAAYYALMAVKKDMIGISMTNAVCMVSPTYSSQQMFGTNPICVAFPCKNEKPWVLDMSTSTAPFGRLENAIRDQAKVPMGWVQNEEGVPSDDPQAPQKGGALTPLGGSPEMSSHKGYGLGVMVDIFSAILSGAKYGPNQEGLTRLSPNPSDVGHFFGAIRLDGFRPVMDFKANMDEMINGLRGAKKAKGHDRIYTHGEPEWEYEEKYLKEGIPLQPLVKFALEHQAKEFDVEIPWEKI